MTIGLLTPYYPDSETINSGLANHFATLAEAVVDLGQKVVVIHIRPRYLNETDAFDKTIQKNITVLTYKVALSQTVYIRIKHKWAVVDFLLKVKCMITAARYLPGIQKTYGLDVIETSSYFSLSYFYRFTFPPIPVVTRVSTTFLQMMDSYYGFKSRLLNRIGLMELTLIKKSKYLITHAHNHALELEHLFGIDAKNFQIIPHGINVPAESELCLDTNSPLKILYVGRMEYRKGTDMLMQAIPLVIKNNSTISFQLIGLDKENGYENKFRADNTDEVGSKVIFSSQLNNELTYKAYAECDVFVAPSRYESFGLIYIEAMSYGKPVIGFSVGGVPEIIEDGVNGLMAETENVVSLAEKVTELVTNNELRKTMGENARATVIKKFSKETLAKSSLAYYEQAIASKHS